MIQRLYDFLSLRQTLSENRIVLLQGPLSCGKTTLARQLPHRLYLDCRLTPDRNLIANPHEDLPISDGLVIIDEAGHIPGLQPLLSRIAEKRPGIRFLLVGAVEPPLGAHSVFRLDGMRPWDVGGGYIESLWFRGGFPASFHCESDLESAEWRRDHLLRIADRACPIFSIDPDDSWSHRFLVMLAHRHGGIRNSMEIARSFQSSEFHVRAWCRRMEESFLIRRMKPWKAATKCRQIRRVKLYIRDSGILHSLLGIEDRRHLLSHPLCAASWEGFALEWIAASLGKTDDDLFFWATHTGNQVHLVWEEAGKLWGVVIHYGIMPRLTHHLKAAVATLGLEHLWIVHAGRRSCWMHRRMTAIPLSAIGPRWNYAMKTVPAVRCA